MKVHVCTDKKTGKIVDVLLDDYWFSKKIDSVLEGFSKEQIEDILTAHPDAEEIANTDAELTAELINAQAAETKKLKGE